jgi:hypothetical protein
MTGATEAMSSRRPPMTRWARLPADEPIPGRPMTRQASESAPGKPIYVRLVSRLTR